MLLISVGVSVFKIQVLSVFNETFAVSQLSVYHRFTEFLTSLVMFSGDLLHATVTELSQSAWAKGFFGPNTMPEAVDMINLGFLSAAEQELILEVLQRDEELRQAEEQRVR